MLKAAFINGFQSHKNTVIKFSEKITVLVGPSYSGKSAILRALNFCINNNHTSNEFINDDTGRCEVLVSAVNKNCNFCVNRIKTKSGKKENKYILEQEGKDKIEFEAFGLTVPSEINRLFNFSDCNYQKQFASPFLAFSSNGEIAREIRKLSGIDIIDDVVSSINSKSLKLSNTIASLEKDIINNDLKIKELEVFDYDKLENLINTYKSCEVFYLSLQDQIPVLEYIINDIKKIDEFLLSLDPEIEGKCQLFIEATNFFIILENDISDITYFINSINAIDSNYSKIPNDLAIRCEEFSNVYDKYNKLFLEISFLDSTIKDIIEIDNVLSNCGRYQEFSNVYDKYINIQAEVADLNISIINIENLNKLIDKSSKLIEYNNEEHLHIMENIDVCPLCERPNLSTNDKKTIIKNYV